jgi:flagellar basal-body rod modification protein FlgD
MAVSATSASDSNAAIAAASSGSPSIAETEQRFLKLLTTQLKNQDPTNPLENAELTSQLAQMSAVSGIEKLNIALQSLVAQSSSNQVLQAASMIGRNVLSPGSVLSLSDGESVPFGIDLKAPAQSVAVTISDADGNVVRTFNKGALSQGLQNLLWDGKDDKGKMVADGKYHIGITATTGDKKVTADALTYTQVVSVAQDASGVSLELSNGNTTNLTNVKRVL